LSKTYLVTGGAGFLGSHLVEQLLNNGHNVICFDNEFRGSFKNLSHVNSEKLIKVKGDIRRFEDWPSVNEKIDGMYHLAAINGTPLFYSMPDTVLDVNVIGTINALEYARKKDIEYFSFASSPEAYGIPSKFPTPEEELLTVPDLDNPRWSYGGSKIIGEVYCSNLARKHGFKCSIIRYNNTYGPRDHSGHVIPDIARKILTGEELVVEGTGEETRSFCFISDTIYAALLIEQKQEKQIDVFNVGNDSETKINKIVSMLLEISNSDIVPKFSPMKNPGTHRRLPNIDKIRKLGFEPQVSLEDGLKITFEWLKENQKSVQINNN